MQFTRHAHQRMTQRSITRSMIDLVLEFGEVEQDKAILDKKDEEIRKWVVTQKKVDEERRVEVEARLRLIFQDKIYEGTDYSPSEGFLLSMDFM